MANRVDTLQVKMTPAEKAQLFELAARDGRSAGSLVRWLVEQYRQNDQKTHVRAA